MDDRLDPRFADAVRGRLMEQVRATAPSRAPRRDPRPPRRRFELVLAGVVAAVAIIAIVLGAVSLGALHRRADPATPELRPPAQPYGGDCERMLPSSAASDVLGVRAVGSIQQDVRVQLAGGLRCLWQGSRKADAETGMQLVAVSASLQGKPAARYCYRSDSGDGEQESCTVSAVADRTWISGTLTASTGTDRSGTIAAAARLERLLVTRGDGGAVLPRRPAGSWSALTCERLGSASGLAAVLRRPHLSVDLANGGSEVPASQIAAWNWTRSTRCLVEDPKDEDGYSFEIDAYPAGAWLEEQAELNNADPITPAPDGVRIFANTFFGDKPGPSGRRAWVIAGPNAIVIDADDVPLTDAQLRTLATALLRALDAAR